MSVIIETSIGDITVDLYTEERPRCSKNFLKLCKMKYYNFNLFHSVQHHLVAQTGDPTGTGRGGESIFGILYGEQARYFDMEVTPRIKHKKCGLLSMVNNGSGMHGSQFFITLGENLDYLDGLHTAFGEIAEGFEVLDKLNETYCDEQHRPYRDIRIYHTVILDDPFDDPEGLVFPDKSPEPSKEMLESDRIGVDEEIDDTKGLKDEEIKEMTEEREAKANAQLLEMVGDLPDADIKPPDNVLFVCKLNPVTTSEDLEMIFSRFGSITSCEVIKDQKTGESLQYAFIEFEKAEHCENAYFKMDNVLIDDRRIHVDFSQSVSKLKPQFKGKKPGKEENEVEDDRPKYVLKNQQRQDARYDLVYEHDNISDTDVSKKKKKHKHRRDSKSDTEGRAKPQNSRSDSESKTRKHNSRSTEDGKLKKHNSRSDDEGKAKKHKHKRSRMHSNEDPHVTGKSKKKSKKHKHSKSKSRSHSPLSEKKSLLKRSRSPSSSDTSDKKRKHRKTSSSPEDSPRKDRRNAVDKRTHGQFGSSRQTDHRERQERDHKR